MAEGKTDNSFVFHSPCQSTVSLLVQMYTIYIKINIYIYTERDEKRRKKNCVGRKAAFEKLRVKSEEKPRLYVVEYETL